MTLLFHRASLIVSCERVPTWAGTSFGVKYGSVVRNDERSTIQTLDLVSNQARARYVQFRVRGDATLGSVQIMSSIQLYSSDNKKSCKPKYNVSYSPVDITNKKWYAWNEISSSSNRGHSVQKLYL